MQPVRLGRGSVALEDLVVKCSNPDCGKEIIGFAVIVNDPMSSIDWEAMGIENILVGADPDGNEVQNLVLHRTCFSDMMEEIEKGEHMVVLNLAIGPVGEVKAALAGEE